MNAATSVATPFLGGLDLTRRRVVVVGGGAAARRRVPSLLDAGAEIVLVAPALSPALRCLAVDGEVVWWARPYQSGDLDGAWLAVVGTGSGSVAAQLAADASARRIFCLGEDDSEVATATVPHAARLGDLRVAVKSDDRPRSSRLLAAIAGAVDAGQVPGLAPAHRTVGVALIGGGLGDPGLLTVRARRLLADADVVVIDEPRCRELVRGLREDVEVIDAADLAVPDGAPGPGGVESVLIDRAGGGGLVVRVTFGDPFLEGAGHAERIACEQAGVPVTVVPGVAAVLAAPAAVDIPVVHRDVAQEIITATLGSADDAVPDWATLGPSSATVVLQVTGSGLGEAVVRLVEHGRSIDTPVAILSGPISGTWHALRATLVDVDTLVDTHALKPPMIVVIGAVAGLSPSTEPRRHFSADRRTARRARAGA